MISLEFNLEKVPGKGEDSNPIVEGYADGSALIVAFDGLGGAGSTKYELDGKQFSGAWFASRMAKSTLAALFRMKKSNGTPLVVDDAVNEYRRVLHSILVHCADQLDKNPSKLKSSLIRRLPTTLTGLYIEPAAGGMKVVSLNAGDSRSYALRPGTGLQQLTVDDLVDPGDALETLYGDSRIANCLHADAEFELKTRTATVQLPAIFIAATDGCFDYVKFPAHFEHILLDTLLKASDAAQWKALLIPEFRAIASDDVSIGLAAVGWKSFSELQNAFRPRHQHLLDEYVIPINTLEQKITDADPPDESLLAEREALRKSKWETYKTNYEAFLPKPAEVPQA